MPTPPIPPPLCPPPGTLYPVNYGPAPIPLRPEPHIPLTPKTGVTKADFEKEVAERKEETATALAAAQAAQETADGKYAKPDGGIPKTDLASDVQASLEKADTALQEHQDISGKADLVGGKVPAAQLPSYVDDVLEFDYKDSEEDSDSDSDSTYFPAQGEDGKIYVDKSTNKTYRWSGSQYVVVGGGDPPVTSVNNKTGAVTLTASDVGAQAVINDLETIRSGAAAGATAVQPESGKRLFSGSYNDLTNVPQSFAPSSHQHTMSDITDYVPPVQAQADWDESDSDDPSFIQNKPMIPAPVDISGKADSTAIADAYNPEKSSAYAVGDYVTYQGSLYKCSSATANPPGAWNAANWTPVAVTDEMGGGAPLPFDAECEYVASPADGGCGIALPYYYYISGSYDLTIESYIPAGSNSSDCFAIGTWKNDNCVCLFANSATATQFRYGSTNHNGTYATDTWQTIGIVGTTVYYGSSEGSFTRSNFSDTTSAFGVSFGKNIRIRRIKLTYKGTDVFDGRPVRVGQIGAMYDVVSRKIFYSSSANNLVPGQDKATPTITTPDRLVEINERNNYLAYASTTTLAPETAVYRANLANDGTFPTITATGIPSVSSYYQFELELTVPSPVPGTIYGPTMDGSAFDSTASYAVGDYVVYDNVEYACVTAHSGPWDASHFRQAWVWLDGHGLPDPADLSGGETIYISVRLDCTARTFIASVWRVA